MKRLWRLLLSRRLAVWTIVAFVAYSAASTIISKDNWSVPYRSPIFLAIAALLTLSTGACAWERTRAAFATTRLRTPSDAALRRLESDAAIIVGVGDAEDSLDRAERALSSLHMRTLRFDRGLEARAGIGGAFGSPIFHWALALLFVVIALGQLTRYQGLMGVIGGYSKPDQAESYGLLDAGPCVGALSGRIISVPSIESSYTANGVDQGVTPYVELWTADHGRSLASGYVFPNHPLRYGSMLIHRNGDGLGAVLDIGSPSGDVQHQVLLDYAQGSTALHPQTFGVDDLDGNQIASVTVDVGQGSSPTRPLVRIRATSGSGSAEATADVEAVLSIGEGVSLPGGLSLRVLQLTKYVRLSVVDDWSVYWIYGLFVLAVIALALAMFAPLRRVRVLLVNDTSLGARLHVAVRHGRGDPHFPARVEAALRATSYSRREVE